MVDWEKKLRRAGNMLIYTYILIMILTFILGYSMEWYIYEEKAAYSNEIMVPNMDYQGQNRIVEDIKPISWRFYLFYVFNVAMIAGYIWFTPEKRAKLEEIGQEIMEKIK